MKRTLSLLLGLVLVTASWADNLSRDGYESGTLANGIPLQFKANKNNKVLALQAFFKGGSTLLTPETAGYETLALTMLTRGSTKYSFAQLKDLQWRTSSELTSGAFGFDGSSYGLVSLPGSFDAMFDAWADGLLHPVWNQTEFDNVLQDAKLNLQRNQQDPYNRAVVVLNRAKFAGHPYRADFSPTAESLAGATLSKVKAWWEANLKSGRITVLAVGDFDFGALKKKLEASLGTLPRAGVVIPAVPKWTTTAQALLVPFPDAGDVGYLRADFPIPPAGDPDYDALNLGFTVLDDILFDVLRSQHGAAYGAWSRSYSFLAPYGSIVVFKTDQPGTVKAYLDEAIGILASGKALASQASASAAGKGGIGAAAEPRQAEYVDLNQVLAFYKAKSVNSFYEGQQTNSAITAQMALALLYRGDVKAYLDYETRLNAVKAEDVVRVIQKYVQNAPKTWVVLAAPELLEGVTADTYTK